MSILELETPVTMPPEVFETPVDALTSFDDSNDDENNPEEPQETS